MTHKKKMILLILAVGLAAVFCTACGEDKTAEVPAEPVALGELIDLNHTEITRMGYEEQPAPGRRAYIQEEETYCYRSGERRETTHGDAGNYLIERLSRLLEPAMLTPTVQQPSGNSCRVWLEGENPAELRFWEEGLVELSRNGETACYTTDFDPKDLLEHFSAAWTIAPLADYLQYDALESASMIAVQNCYPQKSGQVAFAAKLEDVDDWMHEIYVQQGGAEPLFRPQYQMHFEMQFAGMTVPQYLELSRNGLYYNSSYYKTYDFTPEYRPYDLDEVSALFGPWEQPVPTILNEVLSPYLDAAEIASVKYTRETTEEYGSWQMQSGVSDVSLEIIKDALTGIGAVTQIPEIPEEMYADEVARDSVNMVFREIPGVTDYWHLDFSIYDRTYLFLYAYNIDDTYYYAKYRLNEPLDRAALEAVFPADSYTDLSALRTKWKD